MRRLVSLGIAVAVGLGISVAPGVPQPASAAVTEALPFTFPTGGAGALSVGDDATCVLAPEGSIDCWGQDDVNQIDAPTGPFLSLGGAYRGTCAIKADGTLACWGSIYGGAPPAGRYTQVANGDSVSCGIRVGGVLVCWGDNAFGETTVPPNLYVKVAVAQTAVCAIDLTGGIDCWGQDTYGETATPSGTFIDVTTTTDFSCGVHTNGSLACWGRASKLGNMPTSGYFTSVTGAYNHACALRSDGHVFCWGSNSYGEASSPSGTYVAVRAGTRRTCAVVESGSVTCWGNDDHSQNSIPTGTKVRVTSLAISAGFDHMCEIRADSTLFCWGDNASGQLNVPAGTYRAVAASEDFTCAIKTDGTLRCWGDNTYGQSTPPTTAATYVAVSASQRLGCAIDAHLQLKCWGEATRSGTNRIISISAQFARYCYVALTATAYCEDFGGGGSITFVSQLRSIAAGDRHMCAISEDLSLSCFGSNTYGEATPPSGAWTMVAAGAEHNCAIRLNGQMACWGDNRFGQSDPFAGTFVAITAGSDFTCALTTALTLECEGPAGQPVILGPTTPSRPENIGATRGNAQVTVSWTKPSSDGRTPILSYRVTASPGGATCATTTALTCTVTGLTNGTAYTFSVQARNAMGWGLSATSAAATPATVPGAPSGVTAIAHDASGAVQWSAPSSNGGSAITGYTVTATPGGQTCTTTGARWCTVHGLTNGTSYTFKVKAKNAAGTGASSSASNAVTPGAARVVRYAGSDRFETAAVVSYNTFDVGEADVVYIANAYNFPDALGGAAAAGVVHGPVLLAAATGPLNSHTVGELTRLHPPQIVILGGTGVIGADVETALHAYSGSVVRYGGANRFATAADVSNHTFSAATADVVYIANAYNFPDALGGAAAAGVVHGPVLLAAASGSLDAATIVELTRLHPAKIVILGGTGAIGSGVETALHAYSGSVVRYSGTTRFGTAADVSSHTFSAATADVVYIANAYNFPDALGGAAAAGLVSGPVLLAGPHVPLDAATIAQLNQLNPSTIVILGGTGVIDAAVETALAAYLN